MWQKIFVWSKKVHRVVMWAVVILGLYMMFSGYIMHQELEGANIPKWIDTLFLREWHNNVSQWFLLALLGQMLTGVGLWLAPKMLARQRKSVSPVSS